MSGRRSGGAVEHARDRAVLEDLVDGAREQRCDGEHGERREALGVGDRDRVGHDDLVDEIVEEKAEETKAGEAEKAEGTAETAETVETAEATAETTAAAEPETAAAADGDTASVEDKVKAAVEDAKIPLEDKK